MLLERTCDEAALLLSPRLAPSLAADEGRGLTCAGGLFAPRGGGWRPVVSFLGPGAEAVPSCFLETDVERPGAAGTAGRGPLAPPFPEVVGASDKALDDDDDADDEPLTMRDVGRGGGLTGRRLGEVPRAELEELAKGLAGGLVAGASVGFFRDRDRLTGEDMTVLCEVSGDDLQFRKKVGEAPQKVTG